MKKKIIIFALILLLILFLVWFFFLNKKNDGRITLYGNIEIRSSDLAFRVKGRLLKLYAEEGDEVEEGDLLAEIDSDTYRTALNRAKADVKEKRAEKLKKIANYRFNFPLCADSTISKERCSDLKHEMDLSIGAYEASVSDLEQAIINLDDTKLYAPYKGTVLSRIREKGTILDTNDAVYSISMTEPVWVRAYVDEKDLGKVKLGQKAYVYNDARPNKPYIAHVGFVSPVAEFTPKTVETTTLRTDLVYRLRIIIDNTDPFLRQGMPVTVKLAGDEEN
ncbi:MAG: efflux RND transporter periplasmic adaptor subunit [bacterium]|nr:efflux RND transporter periplasmic adaptor subunit [bacterium]